MWSDVVSWGGRLQGGRFREERGDYDNFVFGCIPDDAEHRVLANVPIGQPEIGDVARQLNERPRLKLDYQRAAQNTDVGERQGHSFAFSVSERGLNSTRCTATRRL